MLIPGRFYFPFYHQGVKENIYLTTLSPQAI